MWQEWAFLRWEAEGPDIEWVFHFIGWKTCLHMCGAGASTGNQVENMKDSLKCKTVLDFCACSDEFEPGDAVPEIDDRDGGQMENTVLESSSFQETAKTKWQCSC